MKKILGNLVLAAVVLVGMTSAANAATLCSNQAVTAGLTCSLGTLTFSFTNVSFAPSNSGDTLQLETVDTGIVGNDVVLGFQISPGKGFPVDVILDYTIVSTASNMTGIDASYAGANGSIFESAYNNGNLVSTLTDGNTGSNNGVVFTGSPATFGPFSSLNIHKDIDAISFSEFTDSVQVSGVPEPASLSMMGLGLLGLGLVGRRKRKV
jgi:PEP-CTERM motif